MGQSEDEHQTKIALSGLLGTNLLFPGRKRLGRKKRGVGRELGEGKENEMETSTLSGLSRQRSGHQERG